MREPGEDDDVDTRIFDDEGFELVTIAEVLRDIARTEGARREQRRRRYQEIIGSDDDDRR